MESPVNHEHERGNTEPLDTSPKSTGISRRSIIAGLGAVGLLALIRAKLATPNEPPEKIAGPAANQNSKKGKIIAACADLEDNSTKISSHELDDQQRFCENVRKTEEFIPKFELAFFQFGESVMRMLRDSELSDDYKNFLTGIFQNVMTKSMSPENKNAYIFFGKNLDQVNHKRAFDLFAVAWKDFLLYAVTDDLPEDAAAAYSPTLNTVLLRSSFDVRKTWDLLIAFHELIHHATLNKRRRSAKEEGGEAVDILYDFLSENGGELDIAWEIEAYICEIDIINILLDNELKKSVLEKRNINMDFVHERLGTGTNTPGLKLILDMAQIYYTSVDNTRHNPSISASPEFTAKMARLYEASTGRPVMQYIPVPRDIIEEIIEAQTQCQREALEESMPAGQENNFLERALMERNIRESIEELRAELENGMCYDPYPAQ